MGLACRRLTQPRHAAGLRLLGPEEGADPPEHGAAHEPHARPQRAWLGLGLGLGLRLALGFGFGFGLGLGLGFGFGFGFGFGLALASPN